MPELRGFHHITARTADARANVQFYHRVLGMRMVNYDSPEVYHLYYADETSTPAVCSPSSSFPESAAGSPGLA